MALVLRLHIRTDRNDLEAVHSSIGGLREEQVRAAVMFFTGETGRLERRDFPVDSGNPACPRRPGTFRFSPRRAPPGLWLLPPPDVPRESLPLQGVPPPVDNDQVAPWPRRMRLGQKEEEAYRQFW